MGKRIKWDYEEVIILVNEYFKTKNISNDERSKHITFVSKLLRNRAKMLDMEIDSEFRNIACIYKKFGNIAALDKEYGGSGFSNYSKREEFIVKVYYEIPQMIHNEAELLIKKYSEGMTE